MAPRKPILASEALRATSPRQIIQQGGSIPTSNRFFALRDHSPAPDSPAFRTRSASFKRKNPEDSSQQFSYSDAARVGQTECSLQVSTADDSEIDLSIAKVNSICDKVTTDISESITDPSILELLSQLVEAIRLNTAAIEKVRATRHPTFSQARPQAAQFTTLGAVSKKMRQGNNVPKSTSADAALSSARDSLITDEFESEAGQSGTDPEVKIFRECR